MQCSELGMMGLGRAYQWSLAVGGGGGSRIERPAGSLYCVNSLGIHRLWLILCG